MPEIKEINLIPSELIEKIIIKSRVKKGGVFLFCLIISLLLVSLPFLIKLTKLNGKVKILRDYNQKVTRLEKNLNLDCQNLKPLLKKREIFLHLTNERSYTTPIMINLAHAIDPEIRLINLLLEKGMNTPDKGQMDFFYTLQLSGLGKSYKNLGNFLLNLQKNRSFGEVTLIKSDIDDKKGKFIHFELSLNYYETGQQES